MSAAAPEQQQAAAVTAAELAPPRQQTTSAEATTKQQQRCQVCDKAAAKYCCPRCDHRTCSLECVKAHKEASGCSGKRDRTGFVGRAEFDERAFFSDYRFLEEVKLADDVAKRSRPPAPKMELPQFLQTLQYQARRRGVQLHILSPGMEKRRTNTTRYDGRLQTLQWHVEWSFPAAGGAKAADHKVHENTVMAELLRGHLELQPGAAAKHHALREYSEAGLGQLTVLLRKERTPANAVEYFEIDISRPLRMQLAGKVIVEYPTFVVLLPRERDAYRILPPQAPAQQAQALPTAAGAAGAGAAAGTDAAAAAPSAAAGTDVAAAAAAAGTEPAVAAAGTEAAEAMGAGAGASVAAGAGAPSAPSAESAAAGAAAVGAAQLAAPQAGPAADITNDAALAGDTLHGDSMALAGGGA